MAVALALGVRVHEGALGWLVVIVAAMLVNAAVRRDLAGDRAADPAGGDDDRRRELHRAAAALPLLDPARGEADAALDAGRDRFNPVNWGVIAARGACCPARTGRRSASHMLYLLALTVVTAAFATWTFRAYQRTL